ncbi:Ig-like domain-containing protein [Actinoplanes sp. TRM 88003]|uniref:Ig-like domain-containing protein n=1 Tax=Paractinoplanes aksuensis TaxID=2939490 RepID=A0ABT1DF25_9ACTN|nr:Ig-like domain-containing protein [Actinoplanes aksuensis]MCO8269417.1 Ig-like domain-containing protein [Actinoplanes aksuensis]
MIQRRKVIFGAIGTAAAAVVAGCSTTGKGGGDKAASWVGSAAEAAEAAAPPVQLTVTPAAGNTGVSPVKPVVVSAEGGKIESVTVSAGATKVEGALRDDGTWQSTGDLAYGKKYKVSVTATDAAGVQTTEDTTFTTLKPEKTATVTFQANAMLALKEGRTYGAGQPVIVRFSRAVNKNAAEKAIEIKTSPAVPGKFYWRDDRTVHWRPAKYWAAGTKIDVSVNMFGVKLGKTTYGSKNVSTNFKIGRQLIAISDNRTHMTKVYIDGKLVRTMKSSLGKGGGTTGANGEKISYWTAGGPHVVLGKKRKHTMSSASYGVTDPKDPNYYVSENIEFCTRISYSGEYLHGAPWNKSLGRANLSHGCINLSTADAKWVYNNFLVGDIVDVRNTPRELPIWNGLGDWTVPFDKYGRDTD